MHEIDQPGDRRRPIERLARPGRLKIPPLGECVSSAPQPLDRPVLVDLARPRRPSAAAQRPPDTLGRVFEMALEPGVEGLAEQPLGLAFVEHPEQGIDACLHRSLAQQVGAKAVNRADVRFFEMLHGRLEPGGDRGIRRLAPPLLEPVAQAQLELPGRLLREGHRRDLCHRRTAVLEDAQDAVHQLGGLARAGRGLDDERGINLLRDHPARLRIGAPNHRHGQLLSSSRSASVSCGFRCARRRTPGPQTGR